MSQTSTTGQKDQPQLQEIKRWQSLRWRLIFLLCGVLICALIIIGISVTYFVFLTEQDAWQGRQGEAAHNAAGTVVTFIQGIEDTLIMISLLDYDYLASTPQALQNILRQNTDLLEVVRVNADGQIFATASQETSVLSNVFTISQSQWFLETTAGRSYVSNVQISSKDEPYLIIAVPAADGGAVAARLRMDVLWQVVRAIQFGQTGRAYVINQSGQIVAHTDRKVALANTTIRGRPEVEAIMQTSDYHWNSSYVNFEGVAVVGATHPVPGTDWVVITELSQAEAFAVTRRASFLLGGGLLLFGILILTVTIPLLRRLFLKPLNQLRAGAERIGQGDLDYRINLPRQDEVGQVAQAFNTMAHRLREHEAELLLARDEALQASQLKSELLAKVSHELRTPLNAILGYAEMLQVGIYGAISNGQYRPLTKIIKSTDYLTVLVNSLLNQAQLESGRLELNITSFDIADLLEDVYAKMEVLALTKGLILTKKIDPNVPSTICGDPLQLQQIIVNLVGNAIKFTKSGSVHVYILCPDRNHWAIRVSDTGLGIPAEAQTHIFEPFRQVDGSTTRAYGGTGLGLSIVKQLTVLMGGEITLQSKLGQGSIFTIILPLKQKQEQVDV